MSDSLLGSWRVYVLIGRGLARAAIINLLALLLIFVQHNLQLSDPDVAAELSNTIVITQIAGHELTVLDPVLMTIFVWACAPFIHAALLGASQAADAWRAFRGESA